MKLKNISLKWKLFFFIFIFASIIVLVFVIFQIALLGSFYRSNKINRTADLINDVAKIVDKKDAIDSVITNQLDKISTDEDAAIYIYSNPNQTNETSPITNQDILIYKTNTGGSFENLDLDKVTDIWNIASELNYSKFYIILSNNQMEILQNQIRELNVPKKEIIRELGEDTTSIMCCSFIKNTSNRNAYLLIIDSKIIPVESAVSTLKMQLTYIVIIVVFLTIIIAIIISRIISKPIVAMNKIAKNMAKGDYDVVFNGEGFLEVNELNETLNKTVSELKKTETLRRELMANVSHDLKTPLTMIGGYAEMMRDLPGENNKENLQIIIDEVNHLNILVNDMLDLSRLSSKTVELHPQLFSITDNLIEIVERYQKFQESNHLTIKLEYDANIEVIADESKINQVIYNFFNNAINYSGPTKEVIVKQTIDNHDVIISVIDHGIGIKESDLAYIWDRYYRIDKSHQRSTQGSGLGLSIVKGILEIHNFAYGVESKEGLGSTFWFKMPIKNKEEG